VRHHGLPAGGQLLAEGRTDSVTDRRTDGRTVTGSNKHKIDVYDDADNARVTLSLRSLTPLAMLSGVTMGWLLRLVTGAPLVVGAPDSSRVLSDYIYYTLHWLFCLLLN